MDNLIQNIESTASATVSIIKPKVNNAASVASGVINIFFDWIAAHPKTSLVIAIFIMGFLCGILF